MFNDDILDKNSGKSIEIKMFKPNDIDHFYEQIVDMQFVNITKYHYPHKEISREYVENKISELKKHLETGNTYFIAVITEETILGFIWGYESMFIDEKRMNINSMFVVKQARSLGLGKLLMNRLKMRASKNGCVSISTHYAAFNQNAGRFYDEQDFKKTRIEVMHDLKE